MRNPYPAPFRRLSAILCALLISLSLAGCSNDPTGKTFRYDIDGQVTNLDPQFSTEHGSRIVLDNLYEGLVLQASDGEILPGVASSWEISSDQLIYRFTLRPDAVWSNGDVVTAGDFVFSFQRLFRDSSPHAGKYLAVSNAAAVQNGSVDTASLGVRALSEHQLEIQLAQADPLFLSKLADPAASPCNARAFEQARGRYGLDTKSVCSNGPFSLWAWGESAVQLRRSEEYRSELPTVAGGVTFYLGRDAAEQFLDGKTDVALLNREQQESLPGGSETRPVERTVWCIVFNQHHSTWGNALLRQGLALAIDHELMGVGVPASFQPATRLVPEAMRVMGRPYRDYAVFEPPMEFDTQRAMYLFGMGLEAKGIRELPDSTILIPEESLDQLNVGELQQGWQKYLSAYINFETNTAAAIQSRLRTGDFQMLIMPMSPGDADVEVLLGAFRSDSSQNYFGYNSPIYDTLLAQAGEQSTPQQAAEQYALAEKQLLVDAVVVPLFFETSYLATASGVRNLQVSPFGDHVYFKYAEKDR